MAEHDTLYKKVSDDNGEQYYCPMADVDASRVATDRLPEDCIEASVVGRYAGSIRLENSQSS